MCLVRNGLSRLIRSLFPGSSVLASYFINLHHNSLFYLPYTFLSLIYTHSRGFLEISCVRLCLSRCHGSWTPRQVQALANRILEPLAEVTLKYVLVTHMIEVQGLSRKEFGVHHRRPILQGSNTHDLCICFSDRVIRGIRFPLTRYLALSYVVRVFSSWYFPYYFRFRAVFEACTMAAFLIMKKCKSHMATPW